MSLYQGLFPQVEEPQKSSYEPLSWLPKMFMNLLPTVFKHSLAVKRQETINKKASMWDAWKLTHQAVMGSKDVSQMQKQIDSNTSEQSKYVEGSVEYNRLGGLTGALESQINTVQKAEEKDAFMATVIGGEAILKDRTKSIVVDEGIMNDYIGGIISDEKAMQEKYDSDPDKYAYLLPYIDRASTVREAAETHLDISKQFVEVDELLNDMYLTVTEKSQDKDFWVEGAGWDKLITDIQKNIKGNAQYWQTTDQNKFDTLYTKGMWLDTAHTQLNYLEAAEAELDSPIAKSFAKLAREALTGGIGDMNYQEIKRGLTQFDNMIVEEKKHQSAHRAETKANFNTWLDTTGVQMSIAMKEAGDIARRDDAYRRSGDYQKGEFAWNEEIDSGWTAGGRQKANAISLSHASIRTANEAAKLIETTGSAPSDLKDIAKKLRKTGTVEDANKFYNTLKDYSDNKSYMNGIENGQFDFDYHGLLAKDQSAQIYMQKLYKVLEVIHNAEDEGARMFPEQGFKSIGKKIDPSTEAGIERYVKEVVEEGQSPSDTTFQSPPSPTAADSVNVEEEILKTAKMAGLTQSQTDSVYQRQWDMMKIGSRYTQRMRNAALADPEFKEYVLSISPEWSELLSDSTEVSFGYQ